MVEQRPMSHQQLEVSSQDLNRQLERSKSIKNSYKPFKFCSRRFGFVVLVGSALALQDFTFEYGVMGPRKRVFSDDYMKRNFGEYHKMHMGVDTEFPRIGYPDTGAGFYSKKLSYKDWYTFNCA